MLMSCYNGGEYLGEQLASLAAQRGVRFKLFCRDDGSTDGGRTLRILREFRDSHPGIPTVIVEGINKGFVGSFTELLGRAYAEPDICAFAFCDQDDVWLPDKLSVAQARLEEAGKDVGQEMPVMYCGNTRIVDAGLNEIRDAWRPGHVRISRARALVQSFATGCTMMFNRAAAAIYLERFNSGVAVHDYFMYLICVYFGRVEFDPRPHILYRQHGRNQLGKTGFAGRVRKCVGGGWDSTRRSELQARMFLDTFADRLTAADRKIIGRVAFYRRSMAARLRLILDPAYRRAGTGVRAVQVVRILKGIF